MSMLKSLTVGCVALAASLSVSKPAHASVIFEFATTSVEYFSGGPPYDNSSVPSRSVGTSPEPASSSLQLTLTDDAFASLQNGETISWRPIYDPFSPSQPPLNIADAPFTSIIASSGGLSFAGTSTAGEGLGGLPQEIDLAFLDSVLSVSYSWRSSTIDGDYSTGGPGGYYITAQEGSVLDPNGPLFFHALYGGGSWAQSRGSVPAPGGLALILGMAAFWGIRRRTRA